MKGKVLMTVHKFDLRNSMLGCCSCAFVMSDVLKVEVKMTNHNPGFVIYSSLMPKGIGDYIVYTDCWATV